MGTLRRRLEKLEERHGRDPRVGRRDPLLERVWEHYYHSHENARRELHGLEPMADLPRTEEDHELDRRTLEETIPAYRGSGGWNSPESREFLDLWEMEVRARLEREEDE